MYTSLNKGTLHRDLLDRAYTVSQHIWHELQDRRDLEINLALRKCVKEDEVLANARVYVVVKRAPRISALDRVILPSPIIGPLS
jgi:hypothetical protein